MIRINTTFADSVITQEILNEDPLRDLKEVIITRVCDTADKAVHAALVEMGWTPPGDPTAVNLEYWNGNEWVPAGGPFVNETVAWISLGPDNKNYRTVAADTGRVLTDKSQ